MSLTTEIDAAALALQDQVIAWRRDLHQHPELGNREFRTASIVAEHLRSLGLDDVKTGVAHTGVVGLLKGGQPGGVVALRADMDALPVTELVDLPFASKVRAMWNGEEVGVMHACGHDCHVAILMGVASILASLREQIPGSIKFIFQPAEEMPPEGEEGGAALMIKEGVLEHPTPGAIFGLHVTSRQPAGVIGYRPGPTMASSDKLKITVLGKQTHGAAPWLGVDPIVTSAQIVLGLQTIVSRTLDLNREPAVVTIGAIKGGVRENIIPDTVEMRGTIRSFDEGMRDAIHERITTLAEGIATASRELPGLHHEELPRHAQRPGADRGHAAHADPRGQHRAAAHGHRGGAQGDRRGGLLVLPAADPGAVLLCRRHAAGHRAEQGLLQPLAALHRRRARAGGGGEGAGPPGGGLPDEPGGLIRRAQPRRPSSGLR